MANPWDDLYYTSATNGNTSMVYASTSICTGCVGVFFPDPKPRTSLPSCDEEICQATAFRDPEKHGPRI